MRRRRVTTRVTRSWSKKTSPEVGCSSPAMIRIMVVLPQPDGPRRQVTAEDGKVRFTSRTATVSLNSLRTFLQANLRHAPRSPVPSLTPVSAAKTTASAGRTPTVTTSGIGPVRPACGTSVTSGFPPARRKTTSSAPRSSSRTSSAWQRSSSAPSGLKADVLGPDGDLYRSAVDAPLPSTEARPGSGTGPRRRAPGRRAPGAHRRAGWRAGPRAAPWRAGGPGAGRPPRPARWRAPCRRPGWRSGRPAPAPREESDVM